MNLANIAHQMILFICLETNSCLKCDSEKSEVHMVSSHLKSHSIKYGTKAGGNWFFKWDVTMHHYVYENKMHTMKWNISILEELR